MALLLRGTAFFSCYGRSASVPFRCLRSYGPVVRSPKTGDLSRFYYLKPKEKPKMTFRRVFRLVGITVGAVSGAAFFFTLPLGWPETPIMNEIRKGPLPFVAGHFHRVKTSLKEMSEMYFPSDPEQLLPGPLPDPYQPPYTLVIESTDLLLHGEYSLETGWRYRKRKGLKLFLRSLAQHYEIVIFTKESGFNIAPILESADPDGCISYRLFNDSMTTVDGKKVKDLRRLNRDLKTVIAVDINKDIHSATPENALILKPWKGESSADTCLIELAGMLRDLAVLQLSDVRPALKPYQGDDVDIMHTYRERRQHLLDEKRMRMQKTQEAQKGRWHVGSWRRGGSP